MSILEEEIDALKDEVLDMMVLVKEQLKNAHKCVVEFDQELAEAVLVNDKKVNAADLVIDKKSERMLALHSPVATDLRFILSSIRINTYLERIGDNAEALAKCITLMDRPYSEESLVKLQFQEMMDLTEEMFSVVKSAYKNGEIKGTRKIFALDKQLNEINIQASETFLELIKLTPEDGENLLFLLTTIKKLERIGDLLKNIVEELLFHLEAKVIRHNKKKQEKFIGK